MPSFADSIFLFILALLLFGPKKLPVLARELGKWMGEFRRASNEFKMQMEDELRASEQADRRKQIAAMEAAAPIPPPLDEPAEPEHPHMRQSAEPELALPEHSILPDSRLETEQDSNVLPPAQEATADNTRPVPIATSGSLNMMPPSTGLPTPRSRGGNGALATLVESIPETQILPNAEAGQSAANAQHQPGFPASSLAGVEPQPTRSAATESLAHGD